MIPSHSTHCTAMFLKLVQNLKKMLKGRQIKILITVVVKCNDRFGYM